MADARPATTARPALRVTELLAGLSLTTDLATGAPMETGLAVCAVATAFAGALGLDTDARRTVFHTALLGSVGCTSYAPENAALFDDDTAFQAALHALDPGDPDVFAQQMAAFGTWSGPNAAPGLSARFLRLAPTEGPAAMRASCEVSRALGPRLGLPPAAVEALEDVHERWDGHGIPGTHAGDSLPVAARILHLSEQAVHAHGRGGTAAAVAELARRAGGHLDPDLVTAFLADADALLGVLEEPDLLAHVIAAEPGLPAVVPPDGTDRYCLALSVVADLKGRFLIGHSAHTAALADAAAGLAGFDDRARADLRAAALLHDLGRVAVPSSVWDRAGPLTAGDWERVRLHAYWTGRILLRCPALAGLAPVAAGHHERCDGGGYHRGTHGPDQPFAGRLLAAADVFAAVTEPRPYRPARSSEDAAAELTAEASAGRLDREAVAAVLEGAGRPRPRSAWPAGLTDREVDVLRLAARGMSNRQIADELVVSDRTVGHHLAHVYDKTGRRTRAGAAVFAIEHGLLPG